MSTAMQRSAKKLFRSLASIALTILAGGCLTATMVRFSPGFSGDERLLDARLNAASQEAIRNQQAPERGVPAFYGHHLAGMLRGDLGFSRSLERPVRELLAARLPVTAKLIVLGIGGGWLLGAALATAVVLWRSPVATGIAGTLTGCLLSVPSGVLALLIFYYGGPVQFMIALVLIPKIFQYVRNVLWQAAGQPHVLAARARGLGAARVFFRHVLPVSVAPLVALAGVSFSMAFSAAIPVEVLCDLPGIGQLAWRAALARDLPLLVNITFLIVVVTQSGNLIADGALAFCRRRAA